MTTLYAAQHRILIDTGYDDPLPHRHMAAHIILSRNANMSVTLPDGDHTCHGILIPSGVPHTADTHGCPVLVFLYDSTSSIAREIKKARTIPEKDCRELVQLYDSLTQRDSAQWFLSFEKDLLHRLGLSHPEPRVTEKRITAALDYIRANLSEKLSCHEAADFIHLSPGRFSHLFKQQVGMTFSSYLIYQRLVAAYTWLLQGKSISCAAMDAGFSNASHFADTSRRVFGLSASKFTSNISLVKIE